MSAIGGYFGLELAKKEEYHNAIRLNTGRNAFEYILLSNHFTKVYLPYFTCKVLLEPLQKNGITYSFYRIDKNFEPIFDLTSISENEAFLYTNYFGLKDVYISKALTKHKNIIIDNAQAFFSKPIENISTFYSARKFFGVPDGAYAFTTHQITHQLEKDESYQRFDYLLKRIDQGAEEGYANFSEIENSLSQMPILEMSEITRQLLCSIDYEQIAAKRRANFNYLSMHLTPFNKINFELGPQQVPMVYPFLSEDLTLRNRLTKEKIYTGQYWKEVMEVVDQNDIEYKFANQLVHLPIDQRYETSDLERIINTIKNEHQG